MEPIEFYKGELKATEVFSDMRDDHLAALAGCAQAKTFPMNEKIYVEGEHAGEFLILQAGRAAIDLQSPHRGVLTVHTVGPHEVLGWSWLFPPHRWHYNARAVVETRAISLDGDCVLAKIDQDPLLGYELMKRFSAIMLSRLEATRMQLMDIYDTRPVAPSS